MKKNFRDPPADRDHDADPVDADVFGFADDSDTWLGHLRDAIQPEPAGSIGPYELIEEVSRGGQGVVYRARQPGINRDIAVKRLIAGTFATPAMRRRFEREVEAASALHHPGVVTVYGMEVVDDTPVLAMEWIDGVPITEWVQSAATRDRDAILRMFLRVCDAVQHAHQNGILHRDLKPSNILVDADDQPRVLDFGLAKPLEPDAQGASVTQSARFVGTLAYAAPEQIDGRGTRLDVRSDVYSLGVVLFEMLTDQRPYPATDGLRAHLDAVERRALPRPSALRDDLGAELDAIALKALALEPADRYPSAQHLADDIRRLLADQPVSAHPPSGWYELSKLVHRNRTAFALSLVLALTVVGSAAVAFYQAAVIARERDAESRARRAAESASAQAEREAAKSAAILEFLLRDMLQAAGFRSQNTTVRDVLDAAAERIGERFAAQPALEASVRVTLGESYRRIGREREAEAELAAARAMLAAPDADPRDRALLELSTANLCQHSYRTREAVSHFEAALAGLQRLQPPPWADLATAHRGLAGALYGLSQIEDGRRHYARAAAIAEAHLPADDSTWIAAQTGLVRYDFLRGNVAQARARVEELLVACRDRLGPDTIPESRLRLSLGLAHIHDGEIETGLALARQATAIVERFAGREHPHTAASLGDLAEMLVVTAGDLREAETLLRRALGILQRADSAESTMYAVHAVRLARVLLARGDADQAAALLQRTLPTFLQRRGETFIWTLRSREFLADSLTALGRADAADTQLRLAVEHAATVDLPKLFLAGLLLKRFRGLCQLQRDAAAAAVATAFLDQTLTEPAQWSLTESRVRRVLRWLRRHGHRDAAERWLAARRALEPATAR